MPTSAKVGILVPGYYAGRPPELKEFVRFFQRAEELGFDSLWVTDRVFHAINILDPMTLLTCAASVTSRIRLGTAVILFVFDNPVLMAKRAATLDYLSGGRLTLGISLGGNDREFQNMGVRQKQRVSRLMEGLAVMRKLWSEQDASFNGRYYHLDKVSINPKPVQDGGIPVVMGGRADAVLRRSAQDADGWVAGGQGSPQAYGEMWQKVRSYAEAVGKDSNTLVAGKLMYTCVGRDREECVGRIRSYCHPYYGPQFDVEGNTAYGPPDVCAARVQSYIDAGAKTMLLGPTWPDVHQLDLIARELVPLLR